MGELRILTSPLSGKSLVEDLKKKLEKPKIDANIILLYTSSNSKKDAGHIMDLLKDKFPNAQMAGCTVEGYLTREAVWTKGAAILLIDSDKVTIAHTSGRSTDKLFSRLNKEIKAKNKIVMFPLVYVPNLPNVIKLFAYDKYYYNIRYKRARTTEEKRNILKEYSKILESKIIYPANVALTNLDGEVAGMNLIPLAGGYRSPTLYVNFKECHRCCVCMGIEGKVRMYYHDVFPERGKSFDETVEILKDYFGRAEIVDTISKDIAIGEVNGKTAVRFLKERTLMSEISENDLKNRKLSKDALPMVSPYALGYISKETHGCSMIGLQPYPINIYPSTFNLNKFYESCVFTGEAYKGGISDFYGLFNNVSFEDSFLFFVIDFNIIPMFSKRIHLLRNYIKDNLNNEYIGILSSFPSFKSYRFKRKYLTEIEKNLCFNGTGTSFMVEASDIQVL